MRIYKLIIRASKIHGQGLFAAEDIPANKYLIEYTGEVVTRREALKREKEDDERGITYIFDVNSRISIDAVRGGNESKYINHSCDPNCKVVRRADRIFLYSKKPIKKGEELTYDYAFDKDSKKEICKCGSPRCRGLINEI